MPSVVLADKVKTSCHEPPSECISVINADQQQLEKGSESWWQLEILKLNSLFKFQLQEDLYVALRPWIGNPDVPAEHQPVISMLYGKWLLRRGRVTEANAALESALEGFRARNRDNESSELELKILNILVVLDRFEQAEAYANALIEKGYDSPIFYREVYAELAHIAQQTNARPEHVEYRRKALQWALKTPDDQQWAIGYNNYGVALRMNKEYEKAEKALLKAIDYAEQVGDSIQLHKIILRVAEVYIQMHEPVKAQEFLDKIELRYFPPSQIARYRKLSKQVAAQRNEKSG